MQEIFRKFAASVSHNVGSPFTFVLAVLIVVSWLVTGPIFEFSTTWQLFINTFTTIMTFLMVFLIQNTQNRDAKAIHIKLDELLKGVKGASDRMVGAEEMPDQEMDDLLTEFRHVREKYKRAIERKGGKLPPLKQFSE